MTAQTELRNTARILGWQVHPTPYVDVLIRGDQNIQINYTPKGLLHSAERYRFASIRDLHLLGRTPSRHKKETVLSWLAT